MSLIVVGVLIFFGVFIFVLDWVMNGVMPRFASLGDFFTPSWIDPPDIGTTE
jgi:hypothetical protein